MTNAAKVALLCLATVSTQATAIEWSGDARLFHFEALENIPAQREDSTLGAFRLKLDAAPSDALSFELHGLIEAASPAVATNASVVAGSSRNLFDLETNLSDNSDLHATASLDRAAVTFDQPGYRLTIGRQAITWGVNYFWPAIDLFAPFAPQRIDRDYKPGVDAARLTIPTGDFSEWEIVLAGQGDDFSGDFSLAALRRWNSGNTDYGLMAGRFHTDTVLGGFVVTEVGRFGVRAEVSWTDSGDPADAARGRGDFWRVTLGIDKSITHELSFVGELAWNGYGASDPADYSAVATSDRFLRGETTALGRYYAGASLAWQAHPLLAVSIPLIINFDDRSALLQPNASLSLSDNAVLQLGILQGLGSSSREYGAAPFTIWAGVKYYF